jgi:mRNA interferase MazF
VNPGDVVLIQLPQAGGVASKLRPALLLGHLPGAFQNLLLCGISTQLRNVEGNWDEFIQESDRDFASSGLHRASVIRLSYLYAAEPSEVVGVIGGIEGSRLQRLRQRLSDHLKS